MTVDQMKLVGNYFAKIQTLKRINMMNEKRRKPNRLKIATALLSALLIVTALACNEELVEMPPEIQANLAILKKEHPDWKWIYREFDAPDGKPTEEIVNFVSSNRVSLMRTLEEGNKIGLLINTSIEEFNMAAELTKSADEVFDIVEDQPAPEGGMAEFYKYIGTNMKYPNQARSLGIEGRVFVQFIVDKEGNLTNVVSVKGIGAGCDQEAVRVIENAEKWLPGKQRGETVNMRMILPITFKLDGPDENTPTHNPERLDKIKAPQMEETVVVGEKK
jgi:TonB family protein